MQWAALSNAPTSDEGMLKPSPPLLIVLAAISVFVLLLVSDFAPEAANSFAAVPDDESGVRVICTVLAVKQSASGWTLRLIDGQGSIVGAFISNASAYDPPLTGSVIEATGNFNRARDFLFLESFQTIWSPR